MNSQSNKLLFKIWNHNSLVDCFSTWAMACVHAKSRAVHGNTVSRIKRVREEHWADGREIERFKVFTLVVWPSKEAYEEAMAELERDDREYWDKVCESDANDESARLQEVCDWDYEIDEKHSGFPLDYDLHNLSDYDDWE